MFARVRVTETDRRTDDDDKGWPGLCFLGFEQLICEPFVFACWSMKSLLVQHVATMFVVLGECTKSKFHRVFVHSRRVYRSFRRHRTEFLFLIFCLVYIPRAHQSETRVSESQIHDNTSGQSSEEETKNPRNCENKIGIYFSFEFSNIKNHKMRSRLILFYN